MVKGRRAPAYLEGPAAVRCLREMDSFTAHEVVSFFDAERHDPLLNPWRRGYDAGIRAALGH
jgi:hypothetical protein